MAQDEDRSDQGAGVNTAGSEFNACLRPDGGALIFSSMREGDQGGGDLQEMREETRAHSDELQEAMETIE